MDDRLPVLVIGQPTERIARRLSRSRTVEVIDGRTARPADRARAVAVLVWDYRSTSLAALWPTLRSVRWIQAASAGVDHLMLLELTSADVILTNAAGVFDRSMAEYVLGLVLALAKGLPATVDAQRRRSWDYRETPRIRGATLCVVGLGRIGREVARLGSALGMPIVGVRRSRPTRIPGIRAIHGPEDLAAAVSEARYVVVTTPLTDATRGLIDASVLAAMRHDAYLINVSRGEVVDTRALANALRGGAIAGAALDVFESEPLPPDSDLWTLPNLIVSPHMAGDTTDWDVKIHALFEENVRRFQRGQPLRNRIDLARGY